MVRAWRAALSTALEALGVRVQLNRPYRGTSDGLTKTLRGELPASRYLGIELEVSQRLAPMVPKLTNPIAVALRAALTPVSR